MKLVAYSEEWAIEFQKVKQHIIEATGIEDSRIKHIGSTAIKGMVAKPLLDMMVGVDGLQQVESSILNGLKEIGFYRLRVERPNEIIFAKFTDDTYEEKTHYIHLVEYEGELWKDQLFFKHYLNSHEKEREEYIRLKVEFVQNEDGGIQEYTDFKEEFIKGIYQRRS